MEVEVEDRGRGFVSGTILALTFKNKGKPPKNIIQDSQCLVRGLCWTSAEYKTETKLTSVAIRKE
jgi:hypothetical protein